MSKDSNVAGGNDESSQNPFGFISHFFEQVSKVISEFFKSVVDFFSGNSWESSNKKNTETRRGELKEGVNEESPAKEYKVSPRNLLSQFEEAAADKACKSQNSSSKSTLNESCEDEFVKIFTERSFAQEESKSYSLDEVPAQNELEFQGGGENQSLIPNQSATSPEEQPRRPRTGHGFTEDEKRELPEKLHKHFISNKPKYNGDIDDFIETFSGGVINLFHGDYLPSELKKFHQNYESSSAKINPTTAPNFPTPSLPNSRDSGGQGQ
jgi:hypothetical protein